MNLSGILKKTLTRISQHGGKPLIVGGAVRDWVLGASPKDIDIEVYGIEGQALEKVLAMVGDVDFVGRAFGVYKMRVEGLEFDISLPRTDSKVGVGHTGFDITVNHQLEPEEASRRRDFTINSMLYDPLRGTLIDPHGGVKDLQRRVLKHTSPAFEEDPLRALRAVQFSARFGLDIHPDTATICQNLAKRGALEELPQERVLGELHKFILKGSCHVKGFETWHRTGWLELFPQLNKMRTTPQDPHWHPEGDVLTHTGFSLEALSRISRFHELNDEDKFTVGLGVLCHDMGKPATTEKFWDDRYGREIITSHNHQVIGVGETRKFLAKLGVGDRQIRRVETLVRYHMDHLWVSGRRGVRKYAHKLSQGVKKGGGVNLSLISLVTEADHSGRPPLFEGQARQMQEILRIARSEEVLDGPPKPILSGRDLVEAGVPSGKIMGMLLDEVYKIQIDDRLKTKQEALAWALGNLRKVGAGEVPPVITGQHLLDMGFRPGSRVGELLDKSYLLQLQGRGEEIEGFLQKSRSTEGGLSLAKTDGRVSLSNDTFSRHR
jgi:tRNA nucleotidyltransferase (CCA-adding enzyme)